MDRMRICFAGTPAFAAAHLQAVLNSNHEVVAVYTQPDRPSGRGKKLQASHVKQLAIENSLTVYQPASLKPIEQVAVLAALHVDLLIVVAYGLILPKSILELPKFGCLNVHASLLPRWRGAAPIERAILAGDKESGVTIMQMDEGLDTGSMLIKEAVELTDTDNRIDLEEKLIKAGKTALIKTLANLETLQNNAEIQNNEDSSYATKLEKSEAQIDWKQSADFIGRQIRAGIGRNPAFSFFDNQRVRILEARSCLKKFDSVLGSVIRIEKDFFSICCNGGALDVYQVQLPGKNPAAVKEIANSRPKFLTLGSIFSSEPLVP